MRRKGINSKAVAVSWAPLIASILLVTSFAAFGVISAAESVGIDIYYPFAWGISYTVIIPGLWIVLLFLVYLVTNGIYNSDSKHRHEIPSAAKARYTSSTWAFYIAATVAYAINVAFVWYTYRKYGSPSNHYNEPNGTLSSERWLATNQLSAFTNIIACLFGWYSTTGMYSTFYINYGKVKSTDNQIFLNDLN